MIVIYGPTSSGKTALALQLCKEYGGEIISADSRQVYQEMDIGTGKRPIESSATIIKEKTRWMINGIPVWGYDLVSPSEYFSAYDFAVFAIQKALEIESRGITPFFVGGTGLYIDVVTGRKKLSNPEADLHLRAELNNLSLDELRARLKNTDPERFSTIDTNNRHRLARAIEISESKNTITGKTHREDTEHEITPIVPRVRIELTSANETLFSRADTWVDTIWKNGLIEETKTLNARYPKSDKLTGLVYRTVQQFLKGELTETDAVQRIKFDVHAYIRRQKTWFRTYPHEHTFDCSSANVYTEVSNLLQSL